MASRYCDARASVVTRRTMDVSGVPAHAAPPGWHAGADRFSACRHRILPALALPPEWMDDFVGWTEILGWPFTHEICHTFPGGCAEAVVDDAKVTGLKLVFFYGHTELGSEGADYDMLRHGNWGASRDSAEWSQRCTGTASGCPSRPFPPIVNRDIPEFKKHRLLPCAVLKKDGSPEITREWGKETSLSLRRAEGPTPCWIEMCPGSSIWQRHYHAHLAKMIELGATG